MLKKVISTILAAVLTMSVLAGCGEKKKEEEAVNIPQLGLMGNEVSDSSDMPDWTGKKLKLVYWEAAQFNSRSSGKKAVNDVVTPEIERVTGVTFDAEKSFDNGGESMENKVAKLSAANAWPDIIHYGQKAIVDKLADGDIVYDLKPYLEDYCPNIVKQLKDAGIYEYVLNQRDDGKVVRLPYVINLNLRYPDMDEDRQLKIANVYQTRNHVWVRDDILKKIYPNAKTQDEIEQLYLENGTFTEEDVTDVTFKSKDEFFDFLRKVDALDMKEGNQKVYAGYISAGTDNWNVLTTMGALYGQNVNNSYDTNYFTYWDKETNRIEYKFKQPEFKSVLQDWTNLVRDDILSKESLVDNRSKFEQKRDSGLYAVVYPNDQPNDANIKQNGKGFRYRKVFIDVEPDTDKYLFVTGVPVGDDFAVVKKNVSENDLKQILTYYDYMMSNAGLKLSVWGPKSAGLFDEDADGNRTYKDKELEKCMVYDEQNEKNVYYNLWYGGLTAWPGYASTDVNEFAPKLMYNTERAASQANKYFSMSKFRPLDIVTSISPDIYRIDDKNAAKFWEARTSFEEALFKVYITKNDAEFEKEYKNVISIAERNGLSDDALKGINDSYANLLNKSFMDNIAKSKKK